MNTNTYAGTCAGCLTPTDTALAFVGDREWAVAGLMQLGIPSDQATVMVDQNVRDDPAVVTVRVCANCTRRTSSLPAPQKVGPGAPIPAVRQPDESMRPNDDWDVAVVNGEPQQIISSAAVAALVRKHPMGIEYALARLRTKLSPEHFAAVERIVRRVA